MLTPSFEGLDKVPHFGEFESIRIEGHDPSTIHVIDVQPLSLERDSSGRILYVEIRARFSSLPNVCFQLPEVMITHVGDGLGSFKDIVGSVSTITIPQHMSLFDCYWQSTRYTTPDSPTLMET
jgi:hypothetical protein